MLIDGVLDDDEDKLSTRTTISSGHRYGARASTLSPSGGENYDTFLACTCPPQFKPVTWPAASRSKVIVT